MKQIILVITVIICASISSLAQDFEVEGLKYSLLGNGEVEVSEGNVSGNLIIPEKIEIRGRELTVVRIGKNSFIGKDLTSIKLPSSIRTIDENAFINSSLSSINFPESLYFIGKRAFENTQLDSIFLPQSLAEHPHWRDTGIAEFAFKGCKKLRVVEFDIEGCAAGPGKGSSEKKPIRVYAGAFDDCDNIEKIIYNGAPPIFDPYVNNYKSTTFPKIVKEFATLYCPIEYIGKGRRFRVDEAMEGFATIKPTPKSVPLFELSQKKEGLKEKVTNELLAAMKTGSIGYVDRLFVCGKPSNILFKGDPKIDDIYTKNDSTVILLNKKKNDLIHCKFNNYIEQIKTVRYDDSNFTVISAIYNETKNIAIFKCDVEYISEVYMGNAYGYQRSSKYKTDFCLWYNGQVYRIDKKFRDYINKLFIMVKAKEDPE
ncbi:MAG: leucine-rich repeat domain-containing protein [Bacteroides sp.]|nr:leucine-rich repeat domain-containing protein [Bacteroides sp.]MBD5360477.1 leucine-rich repeat domain-containing protein [Bacteroides sp.]MBD5364479.1 leucine-rich repeat domain-containing protein [Bacteroides sp.]